MKWSEFALNERKPSDFPMGEPTKKATGQPKTRGQVYTTLFDVFDESNINDESPRQDIINKLTSDESTSDDQIVKHLIKKHGISETNARKLVGLRDWFSKTGPADKLNLSKIANDKQKIESIAKKFAELLKKEIGDENLAETVALNAKEKSSGICHSHDFCDANMVMAEAFTAVGIDLDKDYPDMTQNETITGIWGDAWDLAIKNKFWINEHK